MSSGVFDTYLIAQALGWEWNLGTMLLIDGICIGIAIAFGAFLMIFAAWMDSW